MLFSRLANIAVCASSACTIISGPHRDDRKAAPGPYNRQGFRWLNNDRRSIHLDSLVADNMLRVLLDTTVRSFVGLFPASVWVVARHPLGNDNRTLAKILFINHALAIADKGHNT